MCPPPSTTKQTDVSAACSHTSRLPLAGTDRPAAVARHYAHDTLAAWGLADDLVDDALLVADELVANAEEHAGGPQDIRLTLGDGRLVIGVSDDDPHRPSPHCADAGAEHGRGLAIVRALTQTDGCLEGTTSKTVWAALST